jgi:hypothetical protein
MDFKKLTTADWVLGGSSIALFIFAFLPWYTATAKGPFGGGISASQNGYHYFFTGTLPVLLAFVLIGYVVVTKLVDGVKLPELPVGWPLVVLGVAGLAAILVILRLLFGSGEDIPAGASAYVSISRSFGLFLSVLAGLGMAAGAFLKFKEEGGDFKDLKKGSSGTSTGAGTGQGSAPTPF